MTDKVKIIKYAPPPSDLPIYGQVNPEEEVCFFGRTNYESEFESKRYVFGIKKNDRRRHFYVIGKSGVGKSKMIELMIRQDIALGHGLCLMDPHGDIIGNILDFIPENRIKDVILIDPSDINWPISFNPLRNIASEMKHQVTQGLIEIVKKQFGDNWTPRLEYVFRFTCLALLDYPDVTMRGMILMLTNGNYRRKVVKYVQDEMVKRFWAIEFADWSEKFDTEAIIPLVNKLSQFLSNPLLRHIFSQKENKVYFEKIMEERKIILINLSKGKLGEENSSFFGSIFVAKFYQAGMTRANMKENAKKDFYFYIDEFYNVVTGAFINILTEARKYGLCLTLVHQYRGQLNSEVMATIMGNIGTTVIFRLGGEDAAAFEKEMTPIFKAKDMINLGIQEFYVKMTIDGDTADPFSAETLKVLEPTHPSYKGKIIEYNRQNYCAPIEEVKRKISEEDSLISTEEKIA